MITESVASAALRQPLFQAYCAIAEPSSCATLPNVKASRPFAPNRFGPIWSVPMQDATARWPLLIASCTTGAASSTSHVVKMICAPPPISCCAQDFAMSGVLPCVSQVRSSIFRLSTPPWLFQYAIRIFAAASAGLSNGAICPVLSCAQPMMIGGFAPAPPASPLAATAVPIAASAATPTSSKAHLPRPLMLLLPVVIPRLESTRRYPVNADPESRLPDAVETGPTTAPERLR